MANRHARYLAVAALLAFAPLALGEASVESVASALSIGGALLGGVSSTNRQLDASPSATSAALRIHGQLLFSDALSMKLEGVLGAENSRSKSGSLHQTREGYFQKKSENSELRLGRQLIAWGRADKLNPTDYFASRDYTFLTSDDEEQKKGVDAMRAVAHFGVYDLQGVIAQGNARNIWPYAYSGDFNRSNQQFGVKLDRFGEGLDWSASYYHGMDRNPNLLPATGAIVANYDNVSAMGLDFAAASGSLSWRGETAYFRTSDASGQDRYRRNSHLDFVIGVDGSPRKDANLGIQYYGVAVQNYSAAVLADPVAKAGAILGNQLHAYQQGVTLRFAQNWLNDTLQFEMRASFGLTDHGKYLAPKLVYKASDYWSMAFGGEYFLGDTNSYFGQLRKNSGVFMEWRYAW